jgi:hypothetical protein
MHRPEKDRVNVVFRLFCDARMIGTVDFEVAP